MQLGFEMIQILAHFVPVEAVPGLGVLAPQGQQAVVSLGNHGHDGTCVPGVAVARLGDSPTCVGSQLRSLT
ncbi:hypothetical protein GCM10027598_25830 [Amycolatopsis oliviviridis]|uniref:Uncharacterized protein n=1 Tax=Amycolatopsis oliviviridis TaxID=1471590 RepID=A0ABQ3LIC6_9PSEU|nr:hypothetical protein GCM10017790_33480 [Amycolatopsis oliviviridis]